MPGPKRNRRERTDEWASIKQWTLWPEQELYEQIRPLVLFHETAGERAKEIDVPNAHCPGKRMRSNATGCKACSRLVSKAEREKLVIRCHQKFTNSSLTCTLSFPPCPGEKSLRFATSGTAGSPPITVSNTLPPPTPQPSLSARRYQPWHQIPDPAERKLAAIRLHSEGWSITSIASYLATSRHTIYDTLQRWTEEGVAGLDAKPKTNKGVRKATLAVRNEIRKLQENPLLGEYRVHTALLRMGIEVSPATCGRIMAANRQLYGLPKPKRHPRPKLEMPFKAERRHQFWSADVRYIEEDLLPDPKPVYVITILLLCRHFLQEMCAT